MNKPLFCLETGLLSWCFLFGYQVKSADFRNRRRAGARLDSVTGCSSDPPVFGGVKSGAGWSDALAPRLEPAGRQSAAVAILSHVWAT